MDGLADAICNRADGRPNARPASRQSAAPDEIGRGQAGGQHDGEHASPDASVSLDALPLENLKLALLHVGPRLELVLVAGYGRGQREQTLRHHALIPGHDSRRGSSWRGGQAARGGLSLCRTARAIGRPGADADVTLGIGCAGRAGLRLVVAMVIMVVVMVVSVVLVVAAGAVRAARALIELDRVLVVVEVIIAQTTMTAAR